MLRMENVNNFKKTKEGYCSDSANFKIASFALKIIASLCLPELADMNCYDP